MKPERWEKRNPERARENAREWRAKNKEKLSAYFKRRYRENIEVLRERKKAERARYKDRIAETNRRYREANRAELTIKQRARHYGISVEELRSFLAKHDDRCTVCRDPFDQNPKHKHIDHCHATGRLRGVLCRDCNHALGNVKDSVERLEALIAYLRVHVK
jgi:DNA-binding transcriptional MerR regulator